QVLQVHTHGQLVIENRKEVAQVAGVGQGDGIFTVEVGDVKAGPGDFDGPDVRNRPRGKGKVPLIELDGVVTAIKGQTGVKIGVAGGEFVPLDLNDAGRVIERGVGVVGDRRESAPHPGGTRSPIQILEGRVQQRNLNKTVHQRQRTGAKDSGTSPTRYGTA